MPVSAERYPPMRRPTLSLITCFLIVLFTPLVVTAEQSTDFGEYVVHYVALPTTQLSRDVARAYNIKRSNSRAMLNVTVLKKQSEEPAIPVTADVIAVATNLTGQRKIIDMRTVGDGGAIYYIGEFTVAHREVLDFDIQVVTEDSEEAFDVEFRQEFYVL
jgi:hypothetical protein